MNAIKRLFFIINCLLEKEYTIQELQKELQLSFGDGIGSAHKDINKDIEKLKILGFNVSEKSRTREKDNLNNRYKTVGSKYKIESTPYHLNLNSKELELIQDIFKSYSLNKAEISMLFNKIFYYLNIDLDEIIKEEINKDNDLYLKVKRKLSSSIEIRKKVSFEYKAPDKELKIVIGYPYKIEQDHKKIDRLLLLNTYGNYTEYNLERIKSEPEILHNEPICNEFPILKRAKLKLTGYLANSYHLSPEEKLIEQKDDYKIIETPFISEFRLTQKVMKYGYQMELLEPESAINYLKEEINKLTKVYEKD
jgi:hypothetical protein